MGGLSFCFIQVLGSRVYSANTAMGQSPPSRLAGWGLRLTFHPHSNRGTACHTHATREPGYARLVRLVRYASQTATATTMTSTAGCANSPASCMVQAKAHLSDSLSARWVDMEGSPIWVRLETNPQAEPWCSKCSTEGKATCRTLVMSPLRPPRLPSGKGEPSDGQGACPGTR